MTDGAVTPATLTALAEAFHAKHEQTYGHANGSEPVQLVNLRLTALGRLPALALAQPSRPEAMRRGRRGVWFGGLAMDCTVLWREGLAPGETIAGPAVIEALDSTTVVPPGWTAQVAGKGFLRMTRS